MQAGLCAGNSKEIVYLQMWRDKISSLKNYSKGSRCTLQTFEHEFGSGSHIFYEGKVDMVNDNDEVSSVKFNKSGCCAYIYKHVNRDVRMATLCDYNHNSYGHVNFQSSWNDQMSSLYVYAGSHAEESLSETESFEREETVASVLLKLLDRD